MWFIINQVKKVKQLPNFWKKNTIKLEMVKTEMKKKKDFVIYVKIPI